jgi:molecular chaperone DnaK (HSP70)
MAEAFELGKKAFTSNSFDEAVKQFTIAIDAKYKLDITYTNRSACYMAMSKSFEAGGAIQILTQAVDDATAAIKANKKYIKAYVRKGSAQLQLKKYQDAKKTFESGLNIDPTDKALHDGLATANKLFAQQKQSKKKSSEAINSKDIVIGIDLGTTYSCVCFMHNGAVTIIPNDRGDMTTPSYVSFNKAGARQVGMAAKLEAPRNPQNTIFDAKRFIGSSFSDAGVQTDIARYPYSVVDRDGKPTVSITTSLEGVESQKLYAPEEISAMVLGYLKKQAENYLGGPVTKAVVTVPAYFNDAQRAATKAAGAIAGLDVLRIINEPTAAALAYGLDKKSMNVSDDNASNVLIFDLGGGTFDVSVLTIENGVFTVKGTGGDVRLGGEDIDRTVADKIWEKVTADGHVELTKQPRAIKRVMHAIEKAKRELSSVETADIVVEGLIPSGENKKGYDLEYTLTRTEFETLNKNIFNRCLETVKAVLKDASMQPSQIDDIVLVGGSTRIPKLQSMLVDFFGGKQLCKTLNPDEAVAYGAAVQGAILSNQRSTEGLLLNDVTPLSLGIETTGRVMSVIIPRNTAIPCTRTEMYTTQSDWQTEVDVSVYEGERPSTKDNNLLGEFNISGIQKAKKGEPKLQVTFEINSDGMLTVTAKDEFTGVVADINIERGSRASAEEMQRMIDDAKEYAIQDSLNQKTSSLRNDISSKIYDFRQILENFTEKEQKLREQAENQIDKVEIWMENHPEATADQCAKQLSTLALLGRKLRA